MLDQSSIIFAFSILQFLIFLPRRHRPETPGNSLSEWTLPSHSHCLCRVSLPHGGCTLILIMQNLKTHPTNIPVISKLNITFSGTSFLVSWKLSVYCTYSQERLRKQRLHLTRTKATSKLILWPKITSRATQLSRKYNCHAIFICLSSDSKQKPSSHKPDHLLEHSEGIIVSCYSDSLCVSSFWWHYALI